VVRDRLHKAQTETLFGLGFMETIPLPRLSFVSGVFVANHNHLASDFLGLLYCFIV